MASQLFNSVKFGILATIAFFGPKILSESGKYYARFEKSLPPPQKEESMRKTPSPSSIPVDDKPFYSRFFHATEVSAIPSKKSPSSTLTASPTARTGPVEDRRSFVTHYPESTPESPSPSPLVEDGTPITPLERIVRFDLTPDQIRRIWPESYVDLSVPNRTGWRVPVLTGTASDDLAGAITYYFDQRKMTRISFTGRTEDAKKIVSFLTYRFGLVLMEGEESSQVRVYEAPKDKKFPSAPNEGNRLVVRDEDHPDPATRDREKIEFDLYDPDETATF